MLWKLIHNLINAKILTPGCGEDLSWTQMRRVAFLFYCVFSVVEVNFRTHFKNGSLNTKITF